MLSDWSAGGLLFGKMWEDPLAERHLLEQLPGPGTPGERAHPCSVFCVASAGDTAFALASDPRVTVEACDINAAQVQLCHLKQALLKEHLLRGVLETDARPALNRVAGHLPEPTQHFWQRHSGRLRWGLHRAGRVDRSMALLAFLFRTVWAQRGAVEQLLACADVSRQAELLERRWRSPRWTWAFKLALNPLLLKLIYGRALTQDLGPDFPALMQSRMEAFLTAAPAAENPYLWQTLVGHYGPTQGAPYLQDWGQVAFHTGAVSNYLDSKPSSYDFFALSNILEVASPELLQSVLASVLRAARPGALLCLRFIIPRAPVYPSLEFLPEASLRCASMDRAFFCNSFQVYRLP
jgi:S-adenosylmethionine-diacylglycerol 3-amino-3-carboxypropyl transferase